MILMVFTASVVVAVILGRQERRHRIAVVWEYDRRGIPVPPVRPKLKRLEAKLNIGLGLLLLFLGTTLLVANLRVMEVIGKIPAAQSQYPGIEIWEQVAFYWAGGLAMIVLGIRALVHIHRFERAAASAG